MFSIKVVSKDIFDPPHASFYMQDYDSGDGRRCFLMNFSAQRASLAAKIPIGNRALMYVAGHQKFVWAFEYTGTIDDGKRVALLHEFYNPKEKWCIFRPIRHLARVDLANAPTRAEIEKITRIVFDPRRKSMQYISAEDYQKIYDAIPWQWTIGDGPWTSATPLPPAKPPGTDCARTPDNGTNIHPEQPEFVLPPIPNAESLLARIRQVQGMPERNMEDVVKAFLLQLGHAESAVAFQVGHVDVRVNDEQGMGRIVVEVKRTLLNETTRRDAVRKGFDYAGRVGAPLVVITDADIYEVYDQRRGIDYASRYCGRFQLTRFNHADGTVLNLLRPAKR